MRERRRHWEKRKRNKDVCRIKKGSDLFRLYTAFSLFIFLLNHKCCLHFPATVTDRHTYVYYIYIYLFIYFSVFRTMGYITTYTQYIQVLLPTEYIESPVSLVLADIKLSF